MVFPFQAFMELPTIMVPDGVGPTTNVSKKVGLGTKCLPICMFCPPMSKFWERGNYCI